MAAMTRVGSLTRASSTKQTPAAKPARTAWATSSARRVLPTPPVPVSVTRRTAACRSKVQMASCSCSRPISAVIGAGRW